MPVSSNFNIGPIFRILRAHAMKAKSVLDIAAGWGKYGVLTREFYDAKIKGRYDKKDWRTRIDMVEIWKDYVNPVHRYIYDNVYIADIRDLAHKLDSYDVMFLLEVLEHMPKEDGEKLLKILKFKCNKLMFLAFPNYFRGGEGRGWPNPHEEHLCLWTVEDLVAVLDMSVEKIGPTSFVANFVK